MPGNCIDLASVLAWLLCLLVWSISLLYEMPVSVLAWLVCLSVASFLKTLKGSVHEKNGKSWFFGPTGGPR